MVIALSSMAVTVGPGSFPNSTFTNVMLAAASTNSFIAFKTNTTTPVTNFLVATWTNVIGDIQTNISFTSSNGGYVFNTNIVGRTTNIVTGYTNITEAVTTIYPGTNLCVLGANTAGLFYALTTTGTNLGTVTLRVSGTPDSPTNFIPPDYCQGGTTFYSAAVIAVPITGAGTFSGYTNIDCSTFRQLRLTSVENTTTNVFQAAGFTFQYLCK